MKDLQAAKKLIKQSKKHPEWYTEYDIKYAKMVKKRIKEEERDAERRFLENKSE